MKKLIRVETWLPVFSGFYGTIWETDSQEEMEFENINEMRKEKHLPPLINDDAIEWDYIGYTLEVSRSVTNDVSQKLEELGCIQKGEFQELRSPREYNFTNDSINVRFTLTEKNVATIEKYLKDNEEAFSQYLSDRYTSYDGFFASYSNQIEDWTADISETVTHKHKCGSVLQFILLNEEGPEYEMTVYEHVSGNGGYITAKNYELLTEVA